jgi:hypothetical protein
MKRNAIVHLRIQIVGLIVPHNHVAGPPQGGEHGIGKAAIEMAGESDLPWSRFACKRSRHGMNGNRDRFTPLASRSSKTDSTAS